MKEYGDWTAEEWAALSPVDKACALAMSQQPITPEPSNPVVGQVWRVGESEFWIWDRREWMTEGMMRARQHIPLMGTVEERVDAERRIRDQRRDADPAQVARGMEIVREHMEENRE